MDEPARIVIQRRVEWPDTDAAGHWHYSAVVRWVEAAESVLLERLGLLELYGVHPRVRFEVDFLARLWFPDTVDIHFRVIEVGRSSVRYGFEVHRGDENAARGSVTAVYVDRGTGAARPWPDRVRQALREGGEQQPERLASG
jgi:acyl-CoA thioesterase FadM